MIQLHQGALQPKTPQDSRCQSSGGKCFSPWIFPEICRNPLVVHSCHINYPPQKKIHLAASHTHWAIQSTSPKPSLSTTALVALTLEIADSKPTTAEAKSASEDSKLSWSSLHWAVLAWADGIWHLTKSESVCGKCLTYHCRNLFLWKKYTNKNCFLLSLCAMLDLFWGVFEFIQFLFTSHLENHYLHQRQEKNTLSGLRIPNLFLRAQCFSLRLSFFNFSQRFLHGMHRNNRLCLNILTNLNASKLSKVFWIYAILPKSSLAISILDRLYRSNSAFFFFSKLSS